MGRPRSSVIGVLRTDFAPFGITNTALEQKQVFAGCLVSKNMVRPGTAFVGDRTLPFGCLLPSKSCSFIAPIVILAPWYCPVREDTIKDGVTDRFTPSFIYALELGLEQLNATVRGTVAGDGLTEPNCYLRPMGADVNKSFRRARRQINHDPRRLS